MKVFRGAGQTALIIVALASCSDSSVEPPEPTYATTAGAYDAAGDFGVLSFTTTATGQTVDWLDAGATVELRLNEDRTTEGAVFIPGADEDGSEFAADLSGTWTLSNGEVQLDHNADTFLRDMPLLVDSDRLEGDRTFSGTRIQLVLRKR